MLRSLSRKFNAQAQLKPCIQTISRIRKEMEGVSMGRIKEALLINHNDYDKSLQWLSERIRQDGEAKSLKLSQRSAKEGLVVLGERKGLGSVLLELNCESDFVSRNKIFASLASRLTTSALLFEGVENGYLKLKPVAMDHLLEQPLLPDISTLSDFDISKLTAECKETAAAGLSETIGKLGENIRLRRAVSIRSGNPIGTCASNGIFITGSYVHGLFSEQVVPHLNVRLRHGKMASIAVLHFTPYPQDCDFMSTVTNPTDEDMNRMTDASNIIAQHIVGMMSSSGNVKETLEQPFLFNQSLNLGEELQRLAEEMKFSSVELCDFVRFSCGDDCL